MAKFHTDVGYARTASPVLILPETYTLAVATDQGSDGDEMFPVEYFELCFSVE